MTLCTLELCQEAMTRHVFVHTVFRRVEGSRDLRMLGMVAAQSPLISDQC